VSAPESAGYGSTAVSTGSSTGSDSSAAVSKEAQSHSSSLSSHAVSVVNDNTPSRLSVPINVRIIHLLLMLSFLSHTGKFKNIIKLKN
jgi:hypothetical protein